MIIFFKKILGVANTSCKCSDVFKFRARLVSQRQCVQLVHTEKWFFSKEERRERSRKPDWFFPNELHFNPLGYCQNASVEHASQSKKYTQNIIINIVSYRERSLGPSEIWRLGNGRCNTGNLHNDLVLNSYNLLKVTVIMRFKIKFTIKEGEMRTGICLVLDWENGIYSCTRTGI